MLPKNHPLTKVIGNLEVLSIAVTDPLFINGRGNSYPHGFNLPALISTAADVSLNRSLQLGCKPALFSENQAVTITVLSELKKNANVLSVAAFQDAISNLYLVKLFGAKKGTRYPSYAKRYIRDYDMLYPNANSASSRCNALWVTHLLSIVGEIIFKDYSTRFEAYLNFIFGRWTRVEVTWPSHVKRLTSESKVQDLLDAFVVFEKLKTDVLNNKSEEVVTEPTPITDPVVDTPPHPLAKYFNAATPHFEIAIEIKLQTIYFKQIGFNSAKQMLVESTADYALVMIGEKWLVGLLPVQIGAEQIAREFSTLAPVKAVWLSNRHIGKVMELAGSVYTTDGVNLIKFTNSGFIPYGPLSV